MRQEVLMLRDILDMLSECRTYEECMNLNAFLLSSNKMMTQKDRDWSK